MKGAIICPWCRGRCDDQFDLKAGCICDNCDIGDKETLYVCEHCKERFSVAKTYSFKAVCRRRGA